jgi:hypothetical protein
MTFEVRLAFLLAFFALWTLLGFLPWTIAAVVRRGRDVLPALPLAIAGGAAGGVLVPTVGADDARSFLVSLATSFLGGAFLSVLGIWLAIRLTAR